MRLLFTIIASFVSLTASAAPWVEFANDDGSLTVAVVNDDDQFLLQSCDTGDASCRWVLATRHPCEPGKTETPAIVASPAGGYATTLVCLDSIAIKGKTYYRLGFLPFDSVDSAFREVGTVGIAFPLDSGKFRAIRFALAGDTAIDRMREKALKKAKTGTKGQTL